ncbi:MAG: hypothetical protein M3Y18_05700 [Candidatus Eremiobacteraeota bacterium]|nr:hypothetical protein [Candidatus Eremiobacteraeota bacterium]
MSTPLNPAAAKEEAKPTISMTRVIALVPNGGSFGGWGPKVGSASSVVNNWN